MSRKILYVASNFRHLAHFHQPYLRYFSEKGFEVHIAAGGIQEPLAYADRVLEIPFEKRMFAPINCHCVQTLAKEIRRERYHAVSLHTSLAAFFTRLAVMLSRVQEVKVFNTVHGYLFTEETPWPKKTLLHNAEKVTAAYTDVLLTMNRADYHYAQTHRLCKSEVFLIPGMGVDLTRFCPAARGKKRLARSRLAIGDEFVMVYAGEFSRRKNHQLVIEALKLLKDRIGAKWRMIFLGDGALEAEIQARTAEAGLAGQVVFSGYVRDVLPYYQAADVAISASLIEGLPFHLVEAMAVGLPVAATAVKGHEDLIENGENGWLYPASDAKALAEGLQQLYSDERLRQTMGEKGAAKASCFGLDQAYPAITKIYDFYLADTM